MGSRVVLLALLALVVAAHAAEMSAHMGALKIGVDAGFHVSCPEVDGCQECPQTACEGPDVENRNGQCVARKRLATKDDVDAYAANFASNAAIGQVRDRITALKAIVDKIKACNKQKMMWDPATQLCRKPAKGPKGTTGDMGDVGPPGDAGAPGNTGTAGANGQKGATGPKGQRGSDFFLPCPPDWVNINNGRLCMSPMQPANTDIRGALDKCALQHASRVCRHSDFIAACQDNSKFNPFAGTSGGWFGDHGTAAGGNWDDEHGVWNVASCTPNMDGPPQGGGNRNYRCCIGVT